MKSCKCTDEIKNKLYFNAATAAKTVFSLQRELGQVGDLQQQLRVVGGRAEQAQEELQEKRAALEATKTGLEQKLRQLQADKLKLESEAQEVSHSHQ